MSGDYSRRRFDPARHVSGVLMQQGRVQLDADWNELVEALDRRRRAETIDLAGRTLVSRQTADAFQVAGVGAAMTIGPGRIYVDGLLVENHGPAPITFDASLGELRGTGRVPYTAQPYLKNAPLPAAGVPHLVFVDAWQREVTALEDPDLVERAIGVDTTTRVQTAWAVRTLPVGAGVTCATAAAELAQQIALKPSGGRLTAIPSAPPVNPDPCPVPAASGYRGLDNRLYRIEVHKGGALGTARFKWSRDNASIASRVLDITGPRTLVLELTRKDAELQFRKDDWIELTDDRREFSGEPGDLRQVADVDHTTRTLVLKTDHALTFDASRHPRVRRWDHTGGSTEGVPIPSTGGPVTLEHGVQVTFSVDAAGTSGGFKIGDYWMLAARTAGGWVEPLQAAAPIGVHHHYAVLAAVSATGVVTDCRATWNPAPAATTTPPASTDDACCVTVLPGESLQDAIDKLPPEGGCVCAKAGLHTIDATLDIHRPNVSLHGEPGAVIHLKGAGTILDVRSSGARVFDLAFTGTGAPSADLIDIGGADQVFERCSVEHLGAAVPDSRGVRLRDGLRVRIAGNTLINLVEPIYAQDSVDVTIAGNVMRAESGACGIFAEAIDPCRITDNLVAGYSIGILNSQGASMIGAITGNLVEGPTTTSGGVTMATGLCGIYSMSEGGGEIAHNAVANCPTGIFAREGRTAGEGLPIAIDGNRLTCTAEIKGNNERYFAVDVAAPRVVVRANDIELASPSCGGIRLAAMAGRAERNQVRGRLAGGGTARAIEVGRPDGEWLDVLGIAILDHVQPDHCVVEANTMIGAMDGVIAGTKGLSINGLDIRLNRITPGEQKDLPQAGIVIGAANAAVCDNLIVGARRAIAVTGAAPVITGNLVWMAGDQGIFAEGDAVVVSDNVVRESSAGIAIDAADATLAGNRLWDIAAEAIAARASDTVTVDSCDVRGAGQPGAGGPAIALWGRLCRVTATVVSFADALGAAADRRGLAVVIESGGGADVIGNAFSGSSGRHLVEVTYADDTRVPSVTFSNNRCAHAAPFAADSKLAATVRLQGRVVAHGNQVDSAAKFASFLIDRASHLTAVGNASSGDWNVQAPVVVTPSPVQGFNIVNAS